MFLSCFAIVPVVVDRDHVVTLDVARDHDVRPANYLNVLSNWDLAIKRECVHLVAAAFDRIVQVALSSRK